MVTVTNGVQPAFLAAIVHRNEENARDGRVSVPVRLSSGRSN
jgi:hypothetical protein